MKKVLFWFLLIPFLFSIIGCGDITIPPGFPGSTGTPTPSITGTPVPNPSGTPMPGATVTPTPVNSGTPVPGSVVVTTVAGGGADGTSYGDTDSLTGSGARFNFPDGIAMINGVIYVSDASNFKIKMIEPASGYKVTTIAGNGTSGSADNAIGTSATFGFPHQIAVASNGNIYVADGTDSQKIRMIAPTANHPVSTIAGDGTIGTADNSIGTNAKLWYPYGITLATDGIYVTEGGNDIRKIGLTSPYPVSTLTISGGYALSLPGGIIVTNNGIYVTSTTTSNSRIHKLVPSTTFPGTFENITLAGGTAGYADGTGINSRFNAPLGIAVATDGSIYVADANNNTIRKVNPTTGQVTTIAGGGSTGTTKGSVDGVGTAALFNYPHNIVIAPDGSLYVTDSRNNKIRKITFY